MSDRAPMPRLTTSRLTLRLTERDDLAAILDFHGRNREHLAPYSPPLPENFFTPDFWLFHIDRCQEEFRNGLSARFSIFEHTQPRQVVGTVNLTAIQRGPAQMCNLGYSMDHAQQGKGLMSEALREGAIPFAFQSLGLHRIQANYMPTNERSGAVLRRLGFVVEGYARDYLMIGGRWQDHILTSLTNPDWSPA